MAKVLARLRSDVTFPGDAGGLIHRRRRDACPISSPAALDTEWIPIVAAEGWVIITRDSRIQERPAELAAVNEHNAKMVALTGKEALNTWLQLEIVFSQWRRIERLAGDDGPFIWAATRSGLRRVPLETPRRGRRAVASRLVALIARWQPARRAARLGPHKRDLKRENPAVAGSSPWAILGSNQ